mmetsp:Transcript_3409/g.2972  ORF Transcript_3409/g.2972 Transcript_3409/m.2972 type:complete len:90 (+) Transcript_3409:796-1065(+)
MIIDCPNEHYLDSLISNPDFHRFYDKNVNKKDMEIKSIIHLGPTSLFKTDKYKELIAHFDLETTHHMFVNEDLLDKSDLPKEIAQKRGN